MGFHSATTAWYVYCRQKIIVQKQGLSSALRNISCSTSEIPAFVKSQLAAQVKDLYLSHWTNAATTGTDNMKVLGPMVLVS